LCRVYHDREKTLGLSQVTDKLRSNKLYRVHLDRKKVINLLHILDKLYSGATRCVQYTWTRRKLPICHKPLINSITELQDVSSTPGPGENHQSVILITFVCDFWHVGGDLPVDVYSKQLIVKQFVSDLWYVWDFFPDEVYSTQLIVIEFVS
jgi:hypothetical protein